MYEFTSKVRYSEIGDDGKMKLSAVAARMQDACVFHAEAIGRGPAIWKKEHCGWMILSWQILVHGLPSFAQSVTTRTWAWRFRKIESDRNIVMETEDGRVLAEANTRWIYFSMDKAAPIPIPKADVDGYGVERALDTFVYSPRKIALPKESGEFHEPFRIVRTNIDTNHHVNNLQYIDMALAYLPEDSEVKELRVEYMRQVKLGEVLCPRTWLKEGSCLVSLENEKGVPCAAVEFLV